MIAVLADDLSGAAELGGAGTRFGLTAEVQTDFDSHSDAGLVIVDADTRPEAAAVAAHRTGVLGGQVGAARPDLLFKKTDSVFRGPVLAELEALLAATGFRRALLAGGNPAIGRVIRQGRYYIDDVPLDQTEFRDDPEYPARSADVRDLLGASAGTAVQLLRADARLPQTGVIVAEVRNDADLARWAARLDERTLPAGASAFFAAVLRARRLIEASGGRRTAAAIRPIGLFVIGGGSPKSGSIAALDRIGVPIIRAADRLPSSATAEAGAVTATCAGALVEALQTRGAAALAVAPGVPRTPVAARRLRRIMAAIVRELLLRRPVGAILVEGGSTGSTLVRALGLRRLRVLAEAAPGVVWLQPVDRDGPLIVTKPGSYRGIEKLIEG
jgi:D-threonate/D-erythronate kinase